MSLAKFSQCPNVRPFAHMAHGNARAYDYKWPAIPPLSVRVPAGLHSGADAHDGHNHTQTLRGLSGPGKCPERGVAIVSQPAAQASGQCPRTVRGPPLRRSALNAGIVDREAEPAGQ